MGACSCCGRMVKRAEETIDEKVLKVKESAEYPVACMRCGNAITPVLASRLKFAFYFDHDMVDMAQFLDEIYKNLNKAGGLATGKLRADVGQALKELGDAIGILEDWYQDATGKDLRNTTIPKALSEYGKERLKSRGEEETLRDIYRAAYPPEDELAAMRGKNPRTPGYTEEERARRLSPTGKVDPKDPAGRSGWRNILRKKKKSSSIKVSFNSLVREMYQGGGAYDSFDFDKIRRESKTPVADMLKEAAKAIWNAQFWIKQNEEKLTAYSHRNGLWKFHAALSKLHDTLVIGSKVEVTAEAISPKPRMMDKIRKFLKRESCIHCGNEFDFKQ